MRKKYRALTFLFMFMVLNAMLFQNCGQVPETNGFPGDPHTKGTSTGNPSMTNFTYISKTIFEPNCVECHNQMRNEDDIRYDSYEVTIRKGNLTSLHENYLRHQEPDPDCTTISPAEMDLIVAWIDMGAPE